MDCTRIRVLLEVWMTQRDLETWMMTQMIAMCGNCKLKEYVKKRWKKLMAFKQ